MRVVVQKASEARCVVEEQVTGAISFGYMLLVGFTHTDTPDVLKKMALKIAKLRIFEDENHKLNKNITDVAGEILAISQFTLYANCRHGNRPSFTEAMSFTEAESLFQQFVEELSVLQLPVQTGIFGADMKIEFTNVGPTTILLDSDQI